MLKNTLFSSILILHFCSVFSQCDVNPYIEANYTKDAKIMVLREILNDPSDPDYDNPDIPEDRITPYLGKLSAIYENPDNLPEIDSLFSEFQIHANAENSFQTPYKTMTLSVESSANWLEDFKNTGISGISSLDDLMDDYDLTITNYTDLSTCSCTLFDIETGQDFLNINALSDDFTAIDHITAAEPMISIESRFNYEGIPYEVNGRPVEVADILVEGNTYNFVLYSGDCFSGCTNKKETKIQVSDDCNEVTLSSPKTNLKKLTFFPNPASSYLVLQEVPKNIKTVEIYSISGKSVGSFSLQNNRINVSGLSSGIYFINLKTSTKTSETLKFIKR